MQTYFQTSGNKTQAVNPLRRFTRCSQTIVQAFSQVRDGRSVHGLRHPLESILGLVLLGLSVGCWHLSGCVEWAQVQKHRKFLQKYLPFPHRIPDATTVSRALQVLNPQELLTVIRIWRHQIWGSVSGGCSIDGKTLNGIHNATSRHFLSIFSHEDHAVIGQEGVQSKENEITASHRVLKSDDTVLFGAIITGDALLTQTSVVQTILEVQADYVLTVKKNNKELLQVISSQLRDPLLKATSTQIWSARHGREIKTTLVLSDDFDRELLETWGWKQVKWIGKITREGVRPTEELGTGGTVLKPWKEERYFIASVPQLTPEHALKLVTNHWSIENNLHWQKDWTYMEDRHTLRKGFAAQTFSILKGLILELLHRCMYANKSQSLRLFSWDKTAHKQFLTHANIV